MLRGDEVSGSTFWYGALLNRRAGDWLAYWTGGRGRFVMTAMEETGTLQPLSFLTRAGRVDPVRILVLRTGSCKVVDEILENWPVYADANPIVPAGL